MMRITPLLLVTSAWAALVPTPRPVTSQEISIISRNPKPLALAKPTDDSIVPPAKRGASFSLGEVHNMDYQGGDAPMEILKAHTKFGNTLPPKLARAVERNPKMNARFKILLGDITGTVVAYPPPFYDIQYVVPVFIGTPLQEVYLNLDTGSADFWTLSIDTYQPLVNDHTLYRPNESTTADLQEGQAWSVRYGDGSTASGIVYLDNVQLGDTSFPRQAVQSAVHVSNSISRDPFSSGILGMAMGGANTIRPTQQKTYIENIKDELAEPLFTVNIQKGVPGNYNFGYINQSEFVGDIFYSSVDPASPFWKIPLGGYQVGLGEFKPYEWHAIIDTGTTFLLVPDFIVEDYYAKVNGSRFDSFLGMVTFPCEVPTPDLVFGIGPYRGKVPGHYINYGTARGGYCYGGIQSCEGIGMAIIGDILLKSQFVVFDLGEKRVGFAAKETASSDAEKKRI